MAVIHLEPKTKLRLNKLSFIEKNMTYEDIIKYLIDKFEEEK